MAVAGLLLAAGEGRRFGGPKALAVFDGTPLVVRAAATLREAGCEPVDVVVGAAAAAVRAVLAATGAGYTVVDNPDWQQGMGSSLRAGLAALSGQAEAAVVALVDQPAVSAALVRRLVTAWRDGTAAAGAGGPVGAVVAAYRGVGRTPVLLDATVWAEVARDAVGDVGARAWLRTHPQRVRLVECADVGSDADIDTPGDLASLGGGC